MEARKSAGGRAGGVRAVTGAVTALVIGLIVAAGCKRGEQKTNPNPPDTPAPSVTPAGPSQPAPAKPGKPAGEPLTADVAWSRLVGTWRMSDGRTPPEQSPRINFKPDRTIVWTLPKGDGPNATVVHYRVTNTRVFGNEIRLGIVVVFQGREGSPDEFVCQFGSQQLWLVTASHQREVPGPGVPYVRE